MLDYRVSVGFRVKSPFWAPKGPKVGQMSYMALFGNKGKRESNPLLGHIAALAEHMLADVVALVGTIDAVPGSTDL